MDATEESKFDMYRREEVLLDALTPEVKATMPEFDTHYDAFKEDVDDIREDRELQNLNMHGFQEEKTNIREEVVVTELGLASKLMALATNTHNAVLYNECNFKKSDLTRLSDEDLTTAGQTILSRGNTHAAALVAYGVTAGMLTANGVLLGRYIVATPKPKVGIQTKKAATINIKESFTRADGHLKTIEGLARSIQFTNPSFYQQFMLAKRMDAAPRKTLLARGKLIDKDGAPVAYATMVCKTLDINRKVTLLGGFTIKGGPDGIHIITFSRTGYKTVKVKVAIYQGTRAEVEVVMELLEADV